MTVHATAENTHVDVRAGETATFVVSVTNTSETIDAYSVEVYGIDPQWVSTEPARLALFPGDRGDLAVTVALPHDYPSTHRTLALNVRSANDPASFSLADVGLHVVPKRNVSVTADPNLTTGGRTATFGMLVKNAGNVAVDVEPYGIDPEALARFDFDPMMSKVAPGDTVVFRASARGGRAWFGQIKPRPFTLGVVGEPPTEASVVFLQRPRIGRWVMSLLGLLAAAAVFAFMLDRAFGGVVDEASFDGKIVEQALKTTEGGKIPVNPARIAGQLLSSTSTPENPTGVSGIQLKLFAKDDPLVPVASAVTDESGNFEIGGLAEGEYLLQASGAGFDPVWYPGSDTAADAEPIRATLPTAGAGAMEPLKPMVIGGQPGSVFGTVTGGDPVGAIATLVVGSELQPGVRSVAAEIAVSADGSFQFERVPAPGDYTLIVEKLGYATERRSIRLGAAHKLEDLEVRLRPGDGQIAGFVTNASLDRLGGATITATDGNNVFTAVSLTTIDELGKFTLRNLAIPGRYTVTVEADGYSPETRSVVLTDDEKRRDIDFTLTPSVGSISGTVGLDDLGPSGGITVSVGGPQFEVVTTSVSTPAGLGTFLVEPVPTPGVYTVTFSRAGYLPQVVLVELDGSNPSSGSQINTTLVTATGVIGGVVEQVGVGAVADADVLITDGTTEYETTTADEPRGQFEVSGLPPGSYTVRARLTGTTDAVVLVNLLPSDERRAGTTSQVVLQLGIQANITGRVVRRADDGSLTPVANATVRLIPLADFPASYANGPPFACTNANGEYRFSALDGGRVFIVAVYQSSASSAGLELDSQQVTSANGASVPTPRDLVVGTQAVTCP